MAYTDKTVLDAGRALLQQWELHFNPPVVVPAPELPLVEVAEVVVGQVAERKVNYQVDIREERRQSYEEARKVLLDEDGNQVNATQTMIHSGWEQWFSQIANGVHDMSPYATTNVHLFISVGFW